MTFNLIENMKASDAVNFLEYFSQMLLDRVVADEEQLLAGIPSSVRAIPEYAGIESLALGETEAELNEADSITISRNFLEILAKHPTFSPLLEKAWETYSKDKKTQDLDAVNKTLSATLAAMLIIFAATSEATFDYDNITIHKEPASPGLLIEVTAMIYSITGKKKTEEEKKRGKNG